MYAIKYENIRYSKYYYGSSFILLTDRQERFSACKEVHSNNTQI